MTHYTRKYKGPGKWSAALADCKAWLGTARYKAICHALAIELAKGCGAVEAQGKGIMSLRPRIRFLTMSLSLSGIEGFPAQVLVLDVLKEM
jgi:hypothetical protein